MKIINVLFILLVLFIGYIAGIVLTNSKQSPDDPYYFLHPKITHDLPLTIPFEFSKGVHLKQYFWIVPEKKPTLLYIFPGNPYLPKMDIQFNYPDNKRLDDAVDVFNIIKDIDDPVFNIKIFKITNDLTRELIDDLNMDMKLEKRGDRWSTMNFILGRIIYGRDWKYKVNHNKYVPGLYQLDFEVLKTIPELKDRNIQPNIILQSFSRK